MISKCSTTNKTEFEMEELDKNISAYVENGDIIRNWNFCGVYSADILFYDLNSDAIHTIKTYTGTAIGDEKHPTTIFRRISTHIMNWCREPHKYLGIPSDVFQKQIKIRFNVVLITTNNELARRIERQHIHCHRPWLQYSSYRFFSKTNYLGNDLCIEYRFRPAAFRDRLMQEGITVANSDPLDTIIYKLLSEKECVFDMAETTDIKKQMMIRTKIAPKGSEAHKAVKQIIDKRLTTKTKAKSPRGANYNWIVKKIAAMI